MTVFYKERSVLNDTNLFSDSAINDFFKEEESLINRNLIHKITRVHPDLRLGFPFKLCLNLNEIIQILVLLIESYELRVTYVLNSFLKIE